MHVKKPLLTEIFCKFSYRIHSLTQKDAHTDSFTFIKRKIKTNTTEIKIKFSNSFIKIKRNEKKRKKEKLEND